jgi:hypothetical protein
MLNVLLIIPLRVSVKFVLIIIAFILFVLYGELIWTHHLAGHLHMGIIKLNDILKLYNSVPEPKRLIMLDNNPNSSRPYFLINYDVNMGLGNQMFLYASSYGSTKGVYKSYSQSIWV